MTIEAARETFWSRRLRAVKAEARAEADAAARREAEAAEALRAAHCADKSDEEILAELGLADPDQMQAGDDFAAFMDRAVPERLRRRALRNLWRSNPVLANLDGLVDHGEDFTDSATVNAGLQTAYKIGRGMMEHVAALERQAQAETLPPQALAAERLAADEGAGGVADDLPTAAPTRQDPGEAGPTAAKLAADMGQDDAACDQPGAAPRPRHMRFVFDT